MVFNLDNEYQTLAEKYKNEKELFTSFLDISDSQFTLDHNVSHLIIHSVDIAHHKIMDYMNWNEYNNAYIMAKVTLAMAYFNFNINIAKSLSGNQKLSSYSEGNRTESYKDTDALFDEYGLTPEVRAMLPKPRIKVF